MRLAVHLWNMARIRKQMKKSIKSSSAKSPETQGHSLPEGLTEGSMKAGGLEPAKTGLRDRISPICTLSQNGYGDKGRACAAGLPPKRSSPQDFIACGAGRRRQQQKNSDIGI